MKGEIVEVPQPLDQTYRPSAGYASWHHARLAKKNTARRLGCMSPGQGDMRGKKKVAGSACIAFSFRATVTVFADHGGALKGVAAKSDERRKKSRVLDRV